jgi:hypothetical protein
MAQVLPSKKKSDTRVRFGTITDRTDGRTNSLIPFHSKRAFPWRFDVAGKKKKTISLRVKFPTFSSNFNQIRTSTSFHKSYQYQISHKSVQCEPLYTCGQTGMTKLIGAFREYPNSPKMAMDLRVVKYNNLKINRAFILKHKVTIHVS